MADSVENTEVDLDQLQARAPEPMSPAARIRKALRGKHVCPFCGTTRETDLGPCQQCSLEDTPSTRAATRSKLGPWYVLQSRNPSAPGMNFSTLLTLVQKGRVTARSVIRGPTTGQFWKNAAKVKGVSREFGLCWNCGGDLPQTARACPSCKRLQEPPLNPDVLLEIGEAAEDLTEQIWAEDPPANGESIALPPRRKRPEMDVDESLAGRNRPGDAMRSNGEDNPIEEDPAPERERSPVDRLTSRGGVRKEVPAPARTGRRNGGGIIADAHDDLHVPNSLEMAVFQGSFAEQRRGGRPPRRFFRSLFKMLMVAVITAGLVLGALCYFDPPTGQRVAQYWNQFLAWAGLQKGEPTPGRPGARDTAMNRPATQPASVRPDPLAQTKMWDLFREGEKAQREGDYAKAVACFEQINSLPVRDEDKPLMLKSRIEELRKKVVPNK